MSLLEKERGAARRARVTGETQCLPAAGLVIDGCYLSDRGNVRPINEDSACVVTPDEPDTLSRKGILMVVADGMGGHEGGELASRMTVDRMQSFYYESDAEPPTALTDALNKANREVLR